MKTTKKIPPQELKQRIAALTKEVKEKEKQLGLLISECACPTEFIEQRGMSAFCSICGRSYGWYCPDSPDHVCHPEYELDEENGKFTLKLHNGKTYQMTARWQQTYGNDCVFCNQPEERK